MPGIGEAAALGSALGWGLLNVLVRWESRRIDVLLHNALRATFSTSTTLAVLLVIGLLGWHTPRFGPQPLLGIAYLVLSVLLLVAVGDSLYFVAVHRIGVVKAMILSGSSPLITAVLAVLFLAEPLSVGLVLGVVLIPSGLYLVTLPGRGRPTEPVADAAGARSGMLMALAAAVMWAVATIVVRPGLDQVDFLSAVGIRTAAALISVWFVAWVCGRVTRQMQVPWIRVRMALLGGLLTAVASFLFILAIDHAGAARTSILTATSPLYAVPLSAWLLGEAVTRRTLLGAALAVGGVMVVVAL